MNILVETDSEVLKDWAELCLKHKLYIKGRLAKQWFECPDCIIKMALLDHESTPVGWSMLCESDYHWHNELPVISVYILQQYRNKGWGTKLIKACIEDFNQAIFVDDRVKIFKKVPDLYKVKV